MKILLLPPYFFPEKMASSHLDHDRYETFASHGVLMDLFTPMPTRGVSDKVRLTYKKRKEEFAYDNMMRVYRFSMYREGRNPFLRALRYVFCFCKQFYFGWKSKDIDVICLVSTPPIQGMLGAFLKKIKHVPFVYNLQDIFPDSLIGSGLAKKNGVLWKVGRCIEDFTYRHADKIIVISEDFKENLLAKGVPSDKITIVYNWVDENRVVPIEEENNSLYEELNISRNKFTIVYAGNFGNAQNIDVIIQTAELLKNENDIQFLMFGTGGLVDFYKNIVDEKKLSNVYFYPLQPADKVSNVYSLGNLGIVTCKKGLGRGAFPSKTWSIMATGTPVIANYDKDTDLERLVVKNGLGVFSEAGDYHAMAKQILRMYNNKSLCAEYGLNARKYIETNVSKEIATNNYLKVIKSVVSDLNM